MVSEQYQGSERRHFQRRVNKDRREMIRFEPDKEIRRSGDDRRNHVDWDNHNPF